MVPPSFIVTGHKPTVDKLMKMEGRVVESNGWLLWAVECGETTFLVPLKEVPID
jgi:hypothetical protein